MITKEQDKAELKLVAEYENQKSAKQIKKE